jgi:hypothetical protein
VKEAHNGTIAAFGRWPSPCRQRRRNRLKTPGAARTPAVSSTTTKVTAAMIQA